MAALSAAMLLPGIGPASAEATFTFEGGGYGHSVGMSQYGAYGMAREGYTWQQILGHYFTGASPAAADPALLAEPIWIGLTQDQRLLELKVIATGSAPASPATITVGGTTLTAAAGETVVIEPLGGGTCRVTGPGGPVQGPCSIDIAWDGWAEEPTTAIQLGGCVLPDWNAPGGTVWKPCRYARGTLHVRPDNDTATLHLSVEIAVESYVLGISESPYAWGTTGGQAALEAQAVAARSYALHRVVVRGDPASRPWCWCQLYDTTVDQFYAGWGHATQPWINAVRATAGQVMVHPSESRNGALIPIQAFYASSTFGWTEDSENGFTAYVPYLRAVDDHWSTLPAVGNPKARWSRSFTAGQLASSLPSLSTVTGAEVTRCSATGAALEITFTGEGGPRAFSTRELRGLLSLPSLQVIDVGAPPDGSPACQGFAIEPSPRGGSPALTGVAVDDDRLEDSLGNGDGRAQCGEQIEVTATLAAEGSALRAVTAALSSSDPYVSVLWNTTSSYPNLAVGGSGANLNDWDLAISPQAPDGHTAHLTLQVSAQDGGPWSLDVPLPIACAPTAPEDPAGIRGGILAGPGDLNGDGAPDVVIAFARSGERARLQVRDGATGTVLSSVNLGRAGYVPIAAAVLPSFTGSPAAEVAILLTSPGLRARVVIIDPAAGLKVRAFGLASTSTYYDIAALPASGGSPAPRVAVLTRKANGAVRVVVRDAASGATLGGVGFGRALAPAALTPLTDADGSTLLAVLGNLDGGELKVQVRRVADRALLGNFPLDPSAAAGGLATVPGAGGGQLLVAAATPPGGGWARLITFRPFTGEVVSSGPIPGLSTVRDLATLAGLGRGPAGSVAVLGNGPSGGLAAVIDAETAGLVAQAVLPAGRSPQSITTLAAGRNLAVLVIAPSGEATVTIRDGATGTELISFAVP